MLFRSIGFDAYLEYARRRGLIERKSEFGFAHGARYRMPEGKMLVASYHPSQQNTNTGKLTERMFLEVFRGVRRMLNKEDRIAPNREAAWRAI